MHALVVKIMRIIKHNLTKKIGYSHVIMNNHTITVGIYQLFKRKEKPNMVKNISICITASLKQFKSCATYESVLPLLK